eukprot:4071487-Prymnesium_polylepis.2
MYRLASCKLSTCVAVQTSVPNSPSLDPATREPQRRPAKTRDTRNTMAARQRKRDDGVWSDTVRDLIGGLGNKGAITVTTLSAAFKKINESISTMESLNKLSDRTSAAIETLRANMDNLDTCQSALDQFREHVMGFTDWLPFSNSTATDCNALSIENVQKAIREIENYNAQIKSALTDVRWQLDAIGCSFIAVNLYIGLNGLHSVCAGSTELITLLDQIYAEIKNLEAVNTWFTGKAARVLEQRHVMHFLNEINKINHELQLIKLKMDGIRKDAKENSVLGLGTGTATMLFSNFFPACKVVTAGMAAAGALSV